MLDFSFINNYTPIINKLELEFEKALLPWWKDISFRYKSFQDDYTFIILPNYSLAINDFLNIDQSKSFAMANIVRLYYFGNHIHEVVTDEKDQQAGFQLLILLGDFILGKVLQLLCDAKLESLVDIFANMIAKVNEGHIVKYYFDDSHLLALSKNKIPIYEAIAHAAAAEANLSKEMVIKYKSLGANFGMAVELATQSGYLNEATWHLNCCEEIFRSINKSPARINSTLETAINNLHHIINGQKEKAATL